MATFLLQLNVGPHLSVKGMVTFLSFVIYGIFVYYQRGSYMVWEINMGVCPRLEFDNIMFINCLRHDFYIYVHLIFLCKSFANL